MPVPDFQTLMLPLLKLASDGNPHTLSDTVEHMAQEFQLTDEERAEVLGRGQNRLYNRVGWTTTYLKKAGLIQSVGLGRFQITDRGRDVLDSQPATINVAFLESRFQEVSEFRKNRSTHDATAEETPAVFNSVTGTWTRRSGIEKRIRENLVTLIPSEAVRRDALAFLAFAIQNADEERTSAWYLRETEQNLRLMTGRLLACEIGRSTVRVGVIGPVSDDVRDTLGADVEGDSEVKWIPGGLHLTFPIEHAAQATELLKDSFNSFVDLAMARVRRAVSLEDHAPEAVDYIGAFIGRELPQPVPDAQNTEPADDATDEDDATTSRAPKIRGRAPISSPGSAP